MRLGSIQLQRRLLARLYSDAPPRCRLVAMRAAAPGSNPVPTRFEPGSAPGSNLARTRLEPGSNLACAWLEPGSHLTRIWLAPGSHLARTWLAPGSNPVRHLARTWLEQQPGQHTWWTAASISRSRPAKCATIARTSAWRDETTRTLFHRLRTRNRTSPTGRACTNQHTSLASRLCGARAAKNARSAPP